MSEGIVHSKHYLYPGKLFCSRDPHLVTTVLGSCISVCLWDEKKECGGINHFVMPYWNGKGLPTPKFGNVAINKLLDRMISLGCKKEDIVAKVFGGAAMWDYKHEGFPVGARNIELAQRILEELDIPVAGIDVGGHLGRKIIFDTLTGRVRLKRNKGVGNQPQNPSAGKLSLDLKTAAK